MSRQRNIWHLILGISGLSSLGWFINSFSPNSWQKISFFFFLVFLSSILISQYLLRNLRRAFLVSTGLTVFLILRALDLRSPLYIVLLLACLISLELHFGE